MDGEKEIVVIDDDGEISVYTDREIADNITIRYICISPDANSDTAEKVFRSYQKEPFKSVSCYSDFVGFFDEELDDDG